MEAKVLAFRFGFSHTRKKRYVLAIIPHKPRNELSRDIGSNYLIGPSNQRLTTNSQRLGNAAETATAINGVKKRKKTEIPQTSPANRFANPSIDSRTWSAGIVVSGGAQKMQE